MILEGKKISKIANNKKILENIEISISSEKIYGLLGPNGAGKTSLFSILSGLTMASSGEIFFNSKKINQLSFENRSDLGIIYLPQEPSVFRELTVEDNIKAALEAKKYDAKEKDKKMNEIIDDFSLLEISHQKCNSLSGGQRRRVAIARPMALNRKLILLDEPFAGIDPLVISEIKDLIKSLNDKKFGVLISDHNVTATLEICDFIYFINSGELMAKGTPNEILKNDLVKKVYLGEVF